ncbi:MAG: dehypoxanthine futalosine cyclase [Candidatus Sumerlaeaceae bacterium]|nr:dehypoxanthine futalosine cyclase [Candidatus Sumerlaeaceae bacterium]
MNIPTILRKAIEGERLTPEEALELLQHGDLTELGNAAHVVRLRMNHPHRVTYVIERNINYSNVCAADCDFCGFYVKPHDKGRAYTLTRDELDAKIEELTRVGGRQILMQGGLHPSLRLEWYEDLLRYIKQRHGVHIHAFSPPEIHWFAKLSKISYVEVLRRLHEAGLDSLPGGGAEILVDRVRQRITRNKALTDEWIGVMRAVAECGMRGTATMMFGHIETLEERVEHLQRLRSLQDECGVFTAFIAWTYQKSPNLPLQCPTTDAYDYLRTVAVARLFLDNIPHFQASWVTQGAKIGQISLFFGCDDMGSTMIEENVVSAAGTTYKLNAAEIERLIRDAGFEPQRRNFYYDLTDEPRRTNLLVNANVPGGN